MFHPAAEYRNTVRITVIGEDHFKASGRVLVTPGWLVVMGEGGDGSKAPSLVSMTPGEAVKTDRIVAEGLKTSPPSRYTEDTLLGAMETAGKFVSDPALRQALKARGLGTPATRAATIEGLLFAKAGGEAYLMREKGYLVPSSKAISLITFLDSSGISMLTSPAMTGEWEQKLLQMAKGEYRRADFMREIAHETRQMLEMNQALEVALPAWAGQGCHFIDTAVLGADNPNLDWTIPKQGGLRWAQSIGVVAGTTQPDLALEFVKYIVSPEGQARLATASCYWGMPANAKAGDALTAAGFPTYGHVMKGTGHGIAPDGVGMALNFIRGRRRVRSGGVLQVLITERMPVMVWRSSGTTRRMWSREASSGTTPP